MKIKDFLTVKHEKKEDVWKILEWWYRVALFCELACFGSIVYFVHTNNYLSLLLGFISLWITSLLHILIQLGSIDLHLAELVEKK